MTLSRMKMIMFSLFTEKEYEKIIKKREFFTVNSQKKASVSFPSTNIHSSSFSSHLYSKQQQCADEISAINYWTWRNSYSKFVRLISFSYQSSSESEIDWITIWWHLQFIYISLASSSLSSSYSYKDLSSLSTLWD